MLKSPFLLIALMGFLFFSCGKNENQNTLSIQSVAVEGGLISGKTDSSGQVKIFKGIPFAAPPVGDLRWKAPQAAGVIHTDFERGFIKAEVIKLQDYELYKTEAGCRENGKIAIEGKEYVVQDGDIMHFRFNV